MATVVHVAAKPHTPGHTQGLGRIAVGCLHLLRSHDNFSTLAQVELVCMATHAGNYTSPLLSTCALRKREGCQRSKGQYSVLHH